MVASVPQLPKIAIFTLGASSFAEDCTGIVVTPAPGAIQKVVTLDGVTHQDAEPVSWTLDITCVQDWDSVRPGLANYLFANQGTTVAFVFKHEIGAESATNPKMTGSCVLVPIPYGGDANVFAEAKVSLPITGTLVRDATP